MKTKSLLLTAMAIFVAATGFATQLPSMNVIPVQNEKALVAFETLSPAIFELSLENSTGEILFYKKSDTPAQNFQMVFDLKALEDGNYTVCLKHGNCTIKRKLNIFNADLKVSEEIKSYCPYYAYENNLLKVSYLNNAQKNVFLNIYQNGRFITGKRLGKGMFIQKAFDLSELENGTYEVVLSNNNNDYPFIVTK